MFVTFDSSDQLLAEIESTEIKNDFKINQMEFELIGCMYENSQSMLSLSVDPWSTGIIEYDGTKRYGKTITSRNHIRFPTADAVLALYINRRYYGIANMITDNSLMEDDENSEASSVPKRFKSGKATIVTDYDLYVKQSEYVGFKGKSPGNGLFTNIKIPRNTNISTFKGKLTAYDEYCKLPIEVQGWGINVKRGEWILDCYPSRNQCKASHSNDPHNLFHKKTKTVASANSRIVFSHTKKKEGEQFYKLVSIVDIERDQEILWTYSENDEYFK
jgi:hypothetical protein